jgi:hypothetical protein
MTRGAGVILYIAGSSDDESPHRGCGRTEGNYIQPEERAGQSLRLVTDPERNPVQRAKRETNLTEYRGGGRKGWMRRDETTEAGPMYRDDEIDIERACDVKPLGSHPCCYGGELRHGGGIRS